MPRYERYGTRDLTYSCWHRSLPHHHTMIDLDGIEYCNNCNMVLCLVEATHDVGQYKPTTILQELARAANAIGLLVMWTPDEESGCLCGEHSGIKTMRVRRVHPRPTSLVEVTPAELAAWLEQIREQHRAVACASDFFKQRGTT